MDKRVIYTSLWVVPFLSLALLFLVWSFAGESVPPGEAPPHRESCPRRVTFPSGFLKGLREGLAGRRFRWIVIYHAGPCTEQGWMRALESYELVLAAQESGLGHPWIQWGKKWRDRGGVGGDGVFHLAWLGRPTARLRACLVRALEALVSAFSLPVEAVRLPGELPWRIAGRASPATPKGLDGERIRSWIRGSGAGQGRKGR